MTKKPAADVVGIAVNKDEIKTEASQKEEIKNNNTKTENLSVNVERKQFMKLTSIKDITEESVKSITASAISEFISTEILSKSEEWAKDKKSLESVIAQANSLTEKTKADFEKVQKELATVQATVDSLNKEKADREKVETFNSRMNEISAAYELDEELQSAVVEEVKAIASDEDFGKWKKKASILFKGFAKKKVLPEDKKDGGKDDDMEDKNGKVKTAKASVVDDAIDNGKKEKGDLPNSTSTEPTLKEKWAKAFDKDNFEIKL